MNFRKSGQAIQSAQIYHFWLYDFHDLLKLVQIIHFRITYRNGKWRCAYQREHLQLYYLYFGAIIYFLHRSVFLI